LESPSARRRWRLLVAATASIVLLSMTWRVASGHAEGAIYSLPPSQPPPAKESVSFTNQLNQRVSHLPAQLNPPVAESLEQAEARTRVLEHGVVVQGSKTKAAKGLGKSGAHPRTPSVAAGAEGETVSLAAATAPAPLSLAFVGAGVLAVLGLFLGAARGWHPGRAQRARP
jgi:hypothetical protein